MDDDLSFVDRLILSDEEWDKWSDEMLKRCIQDVNLQEKIFLDGWLPW